MARIRRPISFLILLSFCIRLVTHIARGDAAETRCINSERKALLEFRNGVVDDYGVISSWGRRSQDCCLWKGVVCNNGTGHVITLNLQGYWSDDLDSPVGFSGTINSSLLELHHLEHLDLSFNTFPRIPEFIGSLSKLRYLNLSMATLDVSEVPPQLGNLSYLQTLDLSSSFFSLKNTGWLFKLYLLEYLSLTNVDLSVSDIQLENVISRLPSLSVLKLGNCVLPNMSATPLFRTTNFSKSLSILDLSFNYLPSSSIYPWLFNFSRSLTNINLSYNELLGTIPEAFGEFTSVKSLDLSSTGLGGGIPRSFGNFSNLNSLYLTGNSLKEDLTNFFHLLEPAKKSVKVLELSINKLTGSLPDFTTFTALKELHLKHNELNGYFPDKFEQISNLFILDLADNKINGFLPDLSTLSSLRELYFERNRIEGTLAEKIMPLSELQFLGVSSNLLHGTISESHLKNLSRLVYLDLSHNSLALEFNSDWSPTFSLDVMSLSSCKLGPSFPPWIRTQKNFSIIDISDAQINDSVPDWFWKQLTRNLRFMNLSFNHIHGTVPDLMYGNQPNFDLSSNNLSGSVPLFRFDTQTLVLNDNMFSGSLSFLWSLTNIYNLDLSYNQLSGELPDFWMNFTRLTYLNLENNKFGGRIPASMGSMSYLIMLSMRSNSLIGELPSSLQNFTSLQVLDLGENNLSSRIPTWIGKRLLDLRVLSLRFNGFHGNLPTNFCKLAKMQILDISVNNLSGTIPRCLKHLKAMAEIKTVAFLGQNSAGLTRTRLSLSQSKYTFKALLVWKGMEYEYSSTLGLVTSLDLSSNKFNGEIPVEITNLTGLVALNLSRNNLTWQIPQHIGRLRWLDFLDVSRNHLVGSIPTSLSQLSNLGVLDLSNNNLSGRIPTSTQLQSFSASSYTGNPTLCGLPLPNACPGDTEPQNPQISLETDDTGDQDKLITRGFFISLSIGLAFGFWGVWGTLFVNKSWRYAYFKVLNRVNDWIYVSIAVNYTRLKRRS